MSADLDDAAAIEHDDPIGLADGRQAVGDDQARPPDEQAIERRLDQRLVGGVERARRLVEDEDLRVLEQRARDREPLLLAARQAIAALADDGLVSVGQAGDEVVDLRRPRRLRDLLGGASGRA